MTDKIQPTNPDTPTPADHKPGRTDTDHRNTGRKFASGRWRRKLARKTNTYLRGYSDRAMKTGIVSVEW